VCDLADILANLAWLRRPHPFPHIVARDVFKHDYYSALTSQVQKMLSRGLSEVPAKEQFSRSIPGYDAYGFGLNHSVEGPLAIFLSTAWRDLLCGLFGIDVTPYVFAGAHHHTVGSRSGWVHNDLNPVWFPRNGDGGIQIPNHEQCAYRTGAGPLSESEKIEVVRGAAMIFFLLNDDWQPGDGGETGLYRSAQTDVTRPAVSCRPENNSLLAFECTTRSYHAFLTNKRLPRTSIIMWVHRCIEEAAVKFGRESLERWK
jgi:hypothetical protein